jgi:hypothetical protein
MKSWGDSRDEKYSSSTRKTFFGRTVSLRLSAILIPSKNHRHSRSSTSDVLRGVSTHFWCLAAWDDDNARSRASSANRQPQPKQRQDTWLLLHLHRSAPHKNTHHSNKPLLISITSLSNNNNDGERKSWGPYQAGGTQGTQRDYESHGCLGNSTRRNDSLTTDT